MHYRVITLAALSLTLASCATFNSLNAVTKLEKPLPAGQALLVVYASPQMPVVSRQGTGTYLHMDGKRIGAIDSRSLHEIALDAGAHTLTIKTSLLPSLTINTALALKTGPGEASYVRVNARLERYETHYGANGLTISPIYAYKLEKVDAGTAELETKSLEE